MAGSGAKKRHENNQKWLRIYFGVCAGTIAMHLWLTRSAWTLEWTPFMATVFVAASNVLSLVVIKWAVKASYDASGRIVDCEDVHSSTVGMIEYPKDIFYVSSATMVLTCLFKFAWILAALIPVLFVYGLYSTFVKPLRSMQKMAMAAAGANEPAAAPVDDKKGASSPKPKIKYRNR